MPNFTFCNANTLAGEPCHFTARNLTGLCINHDPTYKQQQRENIERGALRSRELREAIPLRLTSLDLADRASVQAAVELIFRLHLLDLLSEKKTRLLLRALGVASRNFDTTKGKHSSHRPNYRYTRAREDLNRNFIQLTNYSQDP